MKTTMAMLLAFCAVTATAGLSPQNRDWAKSPQGYFMTASDRAQWAAVRTDEEAAQFIAAFTARHGGTAFTEEVAKRAALADRYLTIGKSMPGSKTLRGKTIIVLGPPASMDVSKPYRTRTTRLAAPVGISGPAGGGGDAQGASVADVAAASNSGDMGSRFAVDYSFTYPPATAGGKPLVIVMAADPQTGEDALKDSRQSRVLEEQLEAAAARFNPSTPPAH